mmetsp:Transcript_2608/g.2996  ORF Transcript_2608/g.2996 Transcript_2608/m.2996 type:complete len:488 (-) Transcript_2608:118-1581(-)
MIDTMKLFFLTLSLFLVHAQSFINTPQSYVDGASLKASISPDDGEGDGISRRQIGELSVAALGLGVSYVGTRENDPTEYGLWGILPVGTYKKKKTIRETIVKNKIWTLDQKFGILDVQVPLRMTIIKLKEGGLFVYNPIAATRECLGMVQQLIEEHGPIKYIALGSVALEHKVYAGVFAQKFTTAKVFVQPGQYSFPTNLPDIFLGFPQGRTFTLPNSPADAPAELNDNFDFLTLGPLISKDGAFGESVFFHRDTNTLLVTDTVLEVSEDIPEIYESDHKPLLYHARDKVTDVVEDTLEVRKRGWRRVQLFGLFFTPSAIDIQTAGAAYAERRPDINSDFAGIYPWTWARDDATSFKAISGGLLVAPILQTLILNRNPVEVLDFADKVSRWPIQRIIPAHLKNDLAYNGKDYRNAFSFLEAGGVPKGLPKPLRGDLQTLLDAEVSLLESRAIARCPPLPGGKYSREEILAQTIYGCRAGICGQKSSI